jgi:hypothetical protein
VLQAKVLRVLLAVQEQLDPMALLEVLDLLAEKVPLEQQVFKVI